MPSTPIKLNFQRNEYSRFSFGRKNRNSRPPINTIESANQEQSVELLKGNENGAAPKTEYINFGEEDQMEIQGYCLNNFKQFVTFTFIVVTGGILRLVFHWWPQWHLLATHSRCPLQEAEMVLITERYQDKHTSYHVKKLKTLTPEKVLEMEKKSLVKKNGKADGRDSNLTVVSTDLPLNLSVHFEGGVFRQIDQLVLFTCKKITYVWNASKSEFVKLKGLDIGVTTNVLHQSTGLTSHEQFTRRMVYGSNQIVVPQKTVTKLLFLEVLNPFYIFQIFSFILWYIDEYPAYATTILIMSVFGITMSIVQTKKNQKNLKSTVHSSDVATVIRPSSEVESEVISTEMLVPGDILEIPTHGCIMHCDAVLLTGNCIVNESMLTGESVPITKTPVPNSPNLIYDSKEHAKHTLFCGTRVIQTRYLGDQKVLAVVIRTGFSTAKGGLVRSILYPPPVDFRFEKDSYRFIEFLAVIAGIGFCYTIITKALRGVSPGELVIDALDLITITVPPALPAAMTVGRMYAQRRLKKDNIYCISPRTINVSGSIDCVCFDKTGTLTEDGLDMLCVVPIKNRHFNDSVKLISEMEYDDFMFGMVSCHSITIIEGEPTGDPLDLKMFESTKWTIEEHDTSDNTKYDMIFPTVVKPPKSAKQIGRLQRKISEISNTTLHSGFGDCMEGTDGINPYEIGIVREFPFSSSHQRMSVIVRRLGAPNFEYFCKGSPEMILTLCRQDTVPKNFHRVLETYTQQGYRVIAMAHRDLVRMSYPKVQRASRESLETDLTLLGLVVLENRLKPETTPVIQMLNSANIRTIMVTGDNILTALSVAKECEIVLPHQSVITVNTAVTEIGKIPEVYYMLAGNTSANARLSYIKDATTPNGVGGDYSILTNTITEDSASITSMATIESCTGNTDMTAATNSITQTALVNPEMVAASKHKHSSRHTGPPSYNNYRFAMTGKSWAVIKQYYPELIPRIVTRGCVFARMSPDQKQCLIQELQALGYYVAMCGDGANDCGALRAAHCGVSLSDAESSVASPFTSKNPNITCIPHVIRQGRAALVTSFAIFKYMAAYSLTQFISVVLLYEIQSNLTDWQFLYIDLFVITTFAYFFGKTEAYDKKLAKEAPLNSLISLTPVLSLIFQMIAVMFFQIIPFYHVQQEPWFTPYNATDKEVKSVGCFENYAVFTISSFQYIILAVVYSKGKPYRKSMFTNYGFLISATGLSIFSAYLALYPCSFLRESFELILPYEIMEDNSHKEVMNFRLYMLGYAVLNFLVAIIIENVFVDYFIFKKLRFKFHDIKKSKRKFLQIEDDLNADLKWPPLSLEFKSDIEAYIPNVNGPKKEMIVETPTEFDKNSILNCFFDNEKHRERTAATITTPNKETPLNITNLRRRNENLNKIKQNNAGISNSTNAMHFDNFYHKSNDAGTSNSTNAVYLDSNTDKPKQHIVSNSVNTIYMDTTYPINDKLDDCVRPTEFSQTQTPGRHLKGRVNYNINDKHFSADQLNIQTNSLVLSPRHVPSPINENQNASGSFGLTPKINIRDAKPFSESVPNFSNLNGQLAKDVKTSTSTAVLEMNTIKES